LHWDRPSTRLRKHPSPFEIPQGALREHTSLFEIPQGSLRDCPSLYEIPQGSLMVGSSGFGDPLDQLLKKSVTVIRHSTKPSFKKNIGTMGDTLR
jgi:hypothetical protein